MKIFSSLASLPIIYPFNSFQQQGLNGQFIAMILSFLVTVACYWRLSLEKKAGTIMIVSYVIYVIYVLLFAYGVIPDF